MKKRWLVKDAPDAEQVQHLKTEMNVAEVVAYMLVQRGISTFEDAKHFFRETLSRLHDPFLMKNMDRAAERLKMAIDKNEKILVYGDYDVDGTTAVALFYGFLKEQTTAIDYYIPDRYKEGYGVSRQGIDYARENECKLIVTLDCGIKAMENSAYARENGIDMIICDHHTPGEKLPEAIVLDPKQAGCQYPYKELSGCGVGFKLLSALVSDQPKETERLYGFLDLLAISIGADIVDVTGENRLFCRYGLEQLNTNTRPGLDRLLRLAKKEKPLTLTDVVFTIAPRINAAGRMGDAKQAVALLLEEDNAAITEMAKAIHNDNDKRKTIDQEMTMEALDQIERDKEHSGCVTNLVYDPDWHKGVVGIVASRVMEHHYRPTIVLTQSGSENEWTGSARSIEGVNMYDVLEECSDLLLRFGGHYFAAGLTVASENLSAFQQRFDSAVRERLQPEMLIPQQLVERELSFSELFQKGESVHEVPRLKRILKQFEPHGPGNMKPVFVSKNLYARNVKLLKSKHVKMELVEPGHDKPVQGIAFSFPELYDWAVDGPIDVVYTLEENQFRGRTTLQLNIKDARPAHVYQKEMAE